MMLSKKTKYALKALLALAKEYGHGPMLISGLARREGIPKKFLEQILLELKNKGILRSVRGKGGGYMLGKPPEVITFGEVVRLMEGPLAPLPCTSHSSYRRCEECGDEEACGIRSVMKEVRDETSRILDRNSLANVLKEVEIASQRIKNVLMYNI